MLSFLWLYSPLFLGITHFLYLVQMYIPECLNINSLARWKRQTFALFFFALYFPIPLPCLFHPSVLVSKALHSYLYNWIGISIGNSYLIYAGSVASSTSILIENPSLSTTSTTVNALLDIMQRFRCLNLIIVKSPYAIHSLMCL